MNTQDSLFCWLPWWQAAALVSTPTSYLPYSFGRLYPTCFHSHCCHGGYTQAVLHDRHGLALSLGTVLRVQGWVLPVTVRHCSEIAASNKRERPSWQPSFCQIQFPRGWHILCSFFPKLGIMPDWFRSTVCKHWLHGGFHLNMFPPFSLSWNEEQNGGERSKLGNWIALALCC